MPIKKPILTAYFTLTPDMKKRFRGKLRNTKVTIIEKELTIGNVKKDTEILAVFVDSKVTKKMIQAMPKLKLIVTLSTGFDHIDLKAAKAQKIPVCSVPSYGESTVAEYALAMTLNISRHIFHAAKRVKEGDFDYSGLRGFDIEGKTVGVLGTGKIGRHFIQLLSGFGCEVIGFDPYPNKALQESTTFEYVTLPTLLRRSDILSLHAPLTKETTHIINKKSITKMKPGVVLINTARGGLIDSGSLVWGLEKGIIAGAGLDVLEDENHLEDPCFFAEHKSTAKDTETALMNNMLIDHKNTIVTPHNAFNTHEAIGRIVDTTVNNIKAFINGQVQNDVTHSR